MLQVAAPRARHAHRDGRRQPTAPPTRRADEADKQRNRRVSFHVTRRRRFGDNPADMIQNKICMLGGFGVGKTSLVSRFVSSIFSDTYLTTVGVKIDKKKVSIEAGETTLMLWDIYGQDEFQTVRDSYLRGASGYLLVADGTRHATLETAVALQQQAESVVGQVPFLLLLNKSDLDREWQVDERDAGQARRRGLAGGQDQRQDRRRRRRSFHDARPRNGDRLNAAEDTHREHRPVRRNSERTRSGRAGADAARRLPARRHRAGPGVVQPRDRRRRDPTARPPSRRHFPSSITSWTRPRSSGGRAGPDGSARSPS